MSLNRGSSTTPAEDAFYLPADFCRHARSWIGWPGSDIGAETTANIAHVVRTLAEYEPVTVVAPPERAAEADRMCGGSNVSIMPLPHVSPRLRDTGPTFLVDGKGGSAATDWRFNGWGERDTAALSDDGMTHALLGTAEVRRFRAPLTIEGGAFVCDGRATLIALGSAVFDDARNPRLSRIEAFTILQNWLGIGRIIWLDQPLPGDPTMGDVRTLCAFVAPGVAAVPQTDDAAHPYAKVLEETLRRLSETKDARGEPPQILTLPVPAPRTHKGQLLPLAYTAFYPANAVVLVPAYDDPADDVAAEILMRAFPDRTVQQVPALTLAKAGLSLHSITVPHPARLLERDRATVLPKSAWSKPAPDYDALIQEYIDMVEQK